MLSVDQITQNIITQLQILDPTASAEVGTPERKIIEATAEMVAGSQVDLTVLNQQHDLDSMAGGRLDAYLSIYNFGRQQGTPSNGVVTFSRNADALTAIVIPLGTQVQANIQNNVLPTIAFVTTQTVVLEAGQRAVNAPVQCTVAGTIGNIDAHTIVGFGGLQSITGINIVTNPIAFTGGTNQETDAEYKARFQNTFLRNISGTTDMFLALAVGSPTVSMANVVGPISRYQEYMQVPAEDDPAQKTAGGYDDDGTIFPHKRTTVQSDIPYSKFTYPVNYYLTDSTLDPGGAIFFKPGVDYIFNTPPIDASNSPQQVEAGTGPTQPNITILNPFDPSFNANGNVNLGNNAVVLLEHAYMSVSSRNNYNFGILNAIDVFVNGQQLQIAQSVEVVPGSFNDLQVSSTKLWTYQKISEPKIINFRRKLDGAPVPVGNRVQPLYWQPVMDLPDSMTIGDATYFKANYYNNTDGIYYNSKDENGDFVFPAHYALVEEVNSYFGTIRARNGIEWFLQGQNYLPGQGAGDLTDVYGGAFIDAQEGVEFLVDGYYFDQNISDLQAIMEKRKQTTQDVLVHRAKYRYFRPIITIMYSFGSTRSVVDASLTVAISQFFQNTYYGSAIQLSDILQVIHNVPGVDNVRWTNDYAGGHKLEEVGANGISLFDGPFWISDDFFIQDNELAASPSENPVEITARAQNTFARL